MAKENPEGDIYARHEAMATAIRELLKAGDNITVLRQPTVQAALRKGDDVLRHGFSPKDLAETLARMLRAKFEQSNKATANVDAREKPHRRIIHPERLAAGLEKILVQDGERPNQRQREALSDPTVQTALTEIAVTLDRGPENRVLAEALILSVKKSIQACLMEKNALACLIEEIFSSMQFPQLDKAGMKIDAQNILSDDILVAIGCADALKMKDKTLEEKLQARFQDSKRKLDFLSLFLSVIFAEKFPHIKGQGNKKRFQILEEHIVSVQVQGQATKKENIRQDIISSTRDHIADQEIFTRIIFALLEVHEDLTKLQKRIQETEEQLPSSDLEQLRRLFQTIFATFPLVEKQSPDESPSD